MTQTFSISQRQAWLLAIRPKTLPAALAPVLVGTALAINDSRFNLLPALAALLGALLLQIAVNLANDYFDFVRGVDTVERVGPVRVTQSGLIAPEQVRLGMILALTLAALVGLYLIIVGGLPIIIIGIAAILAALAYSGGPFPLGSHGLGDLFVFIFFGLVAVCGTYYVQATTLRVMIVVAAVPVGFLITAILVVNNLRDIDTDRQVGKNTLAVILGQTGARSEYAILLITAYAVPVVLWLGNKHSAWVLLSWLSLPLAIYLIRTLYRASDGPMMNILLARTAQLALLFSLLFAGGLIL